jgi:transaldolase
MSRPFCIDTADIDTMETYASVVDCTTNKALTPRTQPADTATLQLHALDAEPAIAEPAKRILTREYHLHFWEREGRRVL